MAYLLLTNIRWRGAIIEDSLVLWRSPFLRLESSRSGSLGEKRCVTTLITLRRRLLLPPFAKQALLELIEIHTGKVLSKSGYIDS